MSKLVTAVTILAGSMSILSCSGFKSAETISFEKEPSFSVSIDRVIEDKLTMVLVVDDSGSMLAKTAELEADMKDLFTDLIEAQWDIDLHLVTCAFYKAEDSEMKSVSTEDFSGQTTEQKVDGIMDVATPRIDPLMANQDADERCNQSLEKAWGILVPKNKINLSLIISNEDGCGREAEEEVLVDRNGDPRSNCTPITFNQVGRQSLIDSPFEEWVTQITRHSNEVWIPWFNDNIKESIHEPQKYVDFLRALEVRGAETVENFSHIYLPIVVDSPRCLAETLHTELRAREEAERLEALANFTPNPHQDFVFDGLQNTRDIVANIGHSYLKTFELLNQDIEFSKEEGDLSLCEDLSHIVGKVSREIKLRGGGISIALPRPIDIQSMRAAEGDNFKIIRVERPVEVEELGYFEAQNELLRSQGLEWVKISETHWAVDIGFDSGFVNYVEGGMSVELIPNRLVSITGGDRISVLDYEPLGFRENE